MEELYKEINNPGYVAEYQGIASNTKNITKEFAQAAIEEVSDVDEALALREYRYFIFNVWPMIIADHISELKRHSLTTPKLNINRELFKVFGTCRLYGNFHNGINTSEATLSPLYILIKTRYYFMPHLLTPRAAARFTIYVGRFLQDYEIGYVYNNNNIEVGKNNDASLENIFKGVSNTYLYFGNTLKNAIYAGYLEQERFLTYEEEIGEVDSKEELAKEKAILEEMATDVIKRRKILPKDKQ